MFRRITLLWCVVLVVACTLLSGQAASALPEQEPPRLPGDEAPPAVESAAAVTYWTHHFNVCSLVCQTKIAGRNQPLDMVNWWKAVDTPWYISLNEICQSEVKSLVATTGMAAAWVLTKRYDSDCPGAYADQRFGNAILFRYPAADGGTATWFPTQDQAGADPDCTPEPAWSGANECRGMVCMKTSTPAGLAAGCSAHLESSPTSIAVTQSAEYAWYSSIYHPGSKYLAGDFNLHPASATHDFYTESCSVDSPDSYLTYDAVEGMTAKIDYIWLCPGGGGAYPPARSPHCDGTYSDHCYVFRRLTFA